MKDYERKYLLWKIALIAVSVVIGFGLSEVAIRLLIPQGLTGTWYYCSQDGYVCNTRNARVMHQSANRTVYYNFNDHHLRGQPIKQNSYKILVLGDSFTFGWLLNEADTYVSKIQQYSDDAFGKDFFQFLNGGIGASGTADLLAFVEEYGTDISPTAIIVYLNTDDIGRSIKHGIYKLNESGTLDKFKPDLSMWRKIRNILQNNPLYHWHSVQLFRKAAFHIRNYLGYYKDNDNKNIILGPNSLDLQIDPAFSVKYGRALFHRLYNWCKSHNVQLFVLTTGNFIKGEMNPHEPTIAFFLEAKNIFPQESIPYHDISQKLISAKNERLLDFIINNDGHPNEDGSQLIAIYSWQWLHPQLSNLYYHITDRLHAN